MTLREFASGRGVEYNTLVQWLYRNPQIREKIRKEGRSYVVEPEEEVYKVLEEKYPLLKPVEIVHDEEAREDLAQANRKIIDLYEKITELTKIAAQYETMQLAIEQKDGDLEKIKLELEAEREGKKRAEERVDAVLEIVSTAESRADVAEVKAAEADKRAAEAESRIEAAQKAAKEAEEKARRMESAGLFARIFKSW